MKIDFRSFKTRIGRFSGKEEAPRVSENHGKHLITENSALRTLEAYRMARTNLFYSGSSTEGGIVFGVTSASPSDGKSLTCANLAISFAMSGKRVLLIDCDMRKPTQKLAFAVEAKEGLSEFLAGVTDEPTFVETRYENLSLLTSGRCPPNPAELLYRPRLAELMEKVRAAYDFIFVDLPPVAMISDATIVEPHIGAYILIVRMRQSDYRTVQSAAESIESVGGKIAGIMINDVEEKGGSYYYRGKRYGRYGRYYGKYYDKYSTHAASGEGEDTAPAVEAPEQTAPESIQAEEAEKTKN